jgi:hypothetical protein
MSSSTETIVANKRREASLSLLDDLAKELDEGHIGDTFEVAGVMWSMKTLQDHETNWANGYVITTSMTSLISSRRSATMAIGIRAIGVRKPDGTLDMKTIKEYFIAQWEKEKGKLDENAQRIINNSNEYVQQYYFAEQLFAWLSKRPPEFIQNLWSKWLTLEARKEAAEAAMGKSLPADGISNKETTLG